jgi:twitching motility protein PilI
MKDQTVASPRRWLNPGAALDRFKPPRGLFAGVVPVERRKERYGFRIGDLHFLIGQGTASEVLDQATIYPLPNTPPWLMGLINLRGNLVPAFDARPFLGSTENATQQKRWLLILDLGDRAAGLSIDGLPQATTAGQVLSRLPPLSEALRPHVTKGYSRDDIVWLELDHQSFFQVLGGRARSVEPP